jgi:hypothetical protein
VNLLSEIREMRAEDLDMMMVSMSDAFEYLDDDGSDYPGGVVVEEGSGAEDVIYALGHSRVIKVEPEIIFSRFEEEASGFIVRCDITYDTSVAQADIAVFEMVGFYSLSGIAVRENGEVVASVGETDEATLTAQVDETAAAFSLVSQVFARFGMVVLLVIVINVISMGVIFSKAGEPAWPCVIPIYNLCVLARVGERSMWLGVGMWVANGVPIVGFVISAVLWLMISLGVAKEFDKGFLFGIGLFLFAPLFLPILAVTGDRIG